MRFVFFLVCIHDKRDRFLICYIFEQSNIRMNEFFLHDEPTLIEGKDVIMKILVNSFVNTSCLFWTCITSKNLWTAGLGWTISYRRNTCHHKNFSNILIHEYRPRWKDQTYFFTFLSIYNLKVILLQISSEPTLIDSIHVITRSLQFSRLWTGIYMKRLNIFWTFITFWEKNPSTIWREPTLIENEHKKS